MAKMNKDQWETFLNQVEKDPAPVSSVEEYDAPFKYDPTARDGGMINALRMLGNMPYSTYRSAKDVVNVISDLPNTAMSVGGLIAGSGEEISRRLLGTSDTPNAQALRQVGGLLADRYGNPGRTLVEDPIGMGADIAGVMTGTAAGRLINPLRQMPKVLDEAVSSTGNIVRKGMEQGARIGTGFESGAFEKVYQAKKASPLRAKVIDRFMRPQALQKSPKWGAQELYDTVYDITNDLFSERSDDYINSIRSLKLKSDAEPLDLNAIKRSAIETLESDDHKIKVIVDNETNQVTGLDFSKSKIGKKAEQDAIQKTFMDVIKWTGNDIRDVDFLKQRIGSHHISGGDRLNFKAANILIDDFYRSIRKELGDKVAKYDETMSRYEEASDFLRLMNENINVLGKEETVVNKLLPILRDPANYNFRKNFVDQLENKSGVNLSEQVAAMELSQLQAKGLLGRSMMLGGFGYGAYNQNLGMLAMLPMTSPYVMGELFAAMGASARQTKKVRKFIGDIYEKLPGDAVVDGLTVGAVIDKYLQPAWQPNDIVTRLTAGGAPQEPSE